MALNPLLPILIVILGVLLDTFQTLIAATLSQLVRKSPDAFSIQQIQLIPAPCL